MALKTNEKSNNQITIYTYYFMLNNILIRKIWMFDNLDMDVLETI